MLTYLFNATIKVQRRPASPARNALNEPSYGAESAWTIVYNNLGCRIDFEPEIMDFTETGERVNPNPQRTFIYVEDGININPEDRITILTSDDPTVINRLYIVVAVFSDFDTIGNRHHSVLQVQVH